MGTDTQTVAVTLINFMASNEQIHSSMLAPRTMTMR